MGRDVDKLKKTWLEIRIILCILLSKGDIFSANMLIMLTLPDTQAMLDV